MISIIEAINQASDIWWPYVLHITWTSSLVAVALLGVVWLGRRWPGRLRYAILLIALVKFIVPPTLMMPTGLFSWFGPTVVQNSASTPGRAGVEAAGDSSSSVTLGWKSWLMLIHAWGAMVVLAGVVRQIIKLAGLVGRAKTVTSGPVYDQLMLLAEEMGLRRQVRLLVTSRPIVPMAIGLWRLYIIVPGSVHNRLPSEHVRTILAHELAHHRRSDLWMNWFQIVLGMVWWFNPIFRLLNRTLRRLSEDCCDDLLLSRKLTTGENYCQALLTVATDLKRRHMLGVALGFADRMHPLGLRIKRIMDPELNRTPKLSFVTFLPIVVVAALVLPGLPSQARPLTPAGPDRMARGSGSSGSYRVATTARQFTIPPLDTPQLCGYIGGTNGLTPGGNSKLNIQPYNLPAAGKPGQSGNRFDDVVDERDTFLARANSRMNSHIEEISPQYENLISPDDLPATGMSRQAAERLFSLDNSWYPDSAKETDVLPNQQKNSSGGGGDQFADGNPNGTPKPLRSPGGGGGGRDGGGKDGGGRGKGGDGEYKPSIPGWDYHKSGNGMPLLAMRQTGLEMHSRYLPAVYTDSSLDSLIAFGAEARGDIISFETDAETSLGGIASFDTGEGDYFGNEPFTITATPEPATFCLLMVGGLAILLRHRRRSTS
ncbi:MAG: PEP-CTERM sorting domain-containing protein [Phycisphaerae bacterium]|nr:PEP-CTERM sorting domain-containing protein [Phycisphaerae bacterium]